MQRTERVLFVKRQREAARELEAAFAGEKESASGSRPGEMQRQVQDIGARRQREYAGTQARVKRMERGAVLKRSL